MTEQTGNDVMAPAVGLRLGRQALVATGLLALFFVLLDAAGRLRQPIIVDIGPSTGRYGSGFEDSEETPPTTSRWTRQKAEFDIPLEVDASMARFSVRAARYLDEPTHITVTVAGKPFASFEQPRGRQRIQEIEAPLPEGRLDLGLTSEDPKLGMALDWIRIDGARWSIPASEWTVWILPLGICGALFLSGASMAFTAGATAIILLALAAVAAADPFGFVHSMRDVGPPTVLFSLIAARLFRGRAAVVLAITFTVLLKGGFLFHPSYFYNDVRQNDRYVGALRSYEGSLMERSRKAQVDLGVGYPRIVAGKKYAFPYSPVFYLPFTQLPPDRDLVVRAIKHVALFSTVVEVGLACVLARLLLPVSAGAAAWFTFAFPILTSRMLYAMWSTLAGHALDLLVVVAAVRMVERPKDPKATALVLAATLATFLTYVSSLFNTSAFLVILALLAAAVRWRVIALWIAAATTVVFGLYGDFTLTFVREILPAILTGSGHPAAEASSAPSGERGAVIGALSRIVLFSGYGFPLFALAGLFVIARRRDPVATVVKAYAMAFVSLVLLRGLSFGLFKDLKEIEYGGPAFAILSAVALDRIDRPATRWLVAIGLVVTGVWMQYGHFETWSRLVLR
ncbi:MAG: hypothetical protein K1Y01_02760 [Vicinamibacteria bacterium]|nr:hypothetical protein [Vicinamibacteria bacterium]